MNVKVKKMLSLVLAFVMVMGMFPATVFAVGEAGQFVDVPANAWYNEAVQYVCENGLMNGFNEKHFAPGATTTRSMVVTVLHRMEGEPAGMGEGFADVENGKWYTEAVLWAQANGIVEGDGNGIFRPHSPMTREEMMAVFYRYSQYKGYDVSEATALTVFTDSVKIQSYAEDAMAWAVSVGLIVGFPDGTIRPQADSERAQLATVLERFCKINSCDDDNAAKLILHLVSDNGEMILQLRGTQSGGNYGVYRQVNDGEFERIMKIAAVDDTLEFVLDMPEYEGLYRYKAIFEGDSGVCTASNVIDYVVSSTGNGPISHDTDGDILPDEMEDVLGTFKDNPDTDGDGLADGAEYYIFGTDPLKADTDDNGVNDAGEDFDGDALTNIEEYVLGTNPNDDDTDKDGLTDYDEVISYFTDACNLDTDGDGLDDGDEIYLALDPLNVKSDGETPDNERKIYQVLAENKISGTLRTEDNAAIPSLSMVSAGNINKQISISENTSDAFGDSRALIGKAVDVKGSVHAGTITFSLQEEIVPAAYDATSARSAMVICKYNEDDTIAFLETTYSVAENSLSAQIDGDGTYYVMNAKNLFDELGLVMPAQFEESEVAETFLSTPAEEAECCNDDQCQQNDTARISDAEQLVDQQLMMCDIEECSVMYNSTASGALAQADIVFIIDTTGSMGDEISNVKNNINAFIDVLKAKGVSAALALIDYQDILHDGYASTRIHKNGTSNWFYNIDDYKAAIAALYADDGGDWEECAVDALEMARNLDMRPSANKFFILVTDAGYKVDNRYGVSSMDEEIELLKNSGICCSVISASSEQDDYFNLYNDTNGIWADIYGNFKEQLMALADRIGEDIVGDGYWIYLAGAVPMPVKLLEEPVEGSTVDTDMDGVPDVKELESLTPAATIDLDELIAAIGGEAVGETNYGVVKMYKYISNPTKADTDGDGYGDNVDLAKRYAYKTPVILLHGRSDNTADCYGVVTKVFENNKKQNSHWGKDKTENGLKYTEVATHRIVNVVASNGKKTPQNLGYELINTYSYKENGNLFAFNYPNMDMTKKNAEKFAAYLTNLAAYMQKDENAKYFYPTEAARNAKEYELVLIGHSNGGLVSRYFIENMWGDTVVDKLITIDTPHWGSGLADISEDLTTCYPMDIDLNPENAIFGGSYYTYSSLNPFVQDKIRYINENQTDELNYWNHGDVEYYFLAGYDIAAAKDVPMEYLSLNMPFDVELGSPATFGDYEAAFKNSFIKNSSYGFLAENAFFDDVFDLKMSDGDNVVNNQSQFGLKFSDDKDTSVLIKYVPCNGYWMNLDTYMGHWAASHFHGQNQHRRETIQKIANILN